MYEGLLSQSTVIRTRKKTRFMFCSFSLLLCSGSVEVSSYPFDKSSNLFFREFVTKTSQETDLFAIVTKKNVKWEQDDLFVFLIIHSSFFSHWIDVYYFRFDVSFYKFVQNFHGGNGIIVLPVIAKLVADLKLFLSRCEAQPTSTTFQMKPSNDQ